MRILLAILLLMCASLIRAQDIHFTQFYDSPLQLNPAQTGNFDGAYRFVGNLRQQWASIGPPFRTIAISADANEFLRMKNFNLGLAILNDVAGDSRYTTNDIKLAWSYRFRLSADSVHSLRIGSDFAYQNRRIDFSQLEFGEQFNGQAFDPNRPSNEGNGNPVVKLLNLSGGLVYQIQKEERNLIRLGVGMHNSTQPAITMLSADMTLVNRKMSFFAEGRYPLSYSWDIEPHLLYQFQRPHQELVIGTNFRYIMDDRFYHYRAIFFGINSRIGDAANGIVGMHYGSWKFGLSYDVNYSPLTAASNYRGGIELDVIYIMRNVLPKRIRYRSCPNYL